MDIIYEDQDILVCQKKAGIPVQSKGLRVKDMESSIKTYLAEKNPGKVPYLGIVHRLDQPVQGVIVFAKNQKAAGNLSDQIRLGKMKKVYQAVVCGVPKEREGELTHYLAKDGRNNCSKVVDAHCKEGKKAQLTYRVLKVKEDKSAALVEIHLLTGRHHQIRVQMAKEGMPLWGDTKYNPQFQEEKSVTTALCASRLELNHPATKKHMVFECCPKGSIWNEIG